MPAKHDPAARRPRDLPVLARLRGAGRALIVLSALLLLPDAPLTEGGREAQLVDILDRLAERAALYERTALKFSCREEARVSKYDSDGDLKKQEIDYHDYLLETTDKGRLIPYRALLSHNGNPVKRHEVQPVYDVPEPYSWHLLFTKERRERFHFELVGPHVEPPNFTWEIKFRTMLSYGDGSTIDQWEGTAWVDQDTFDLIRIEAAPANQAATLEARSSAYRQSFRVLGMGTKKRPKTRQMSVEFGFTREQIRLPSRVFASTKLVDLYDGHPIRMKDSVALSYDSYVFYDVETQGKFDEMRDSTP